MSTHVDGDERRPGTPDDDELSIQAILRLRGVNYGDAAPHPDPVDAAAAAAIAQPRTAVQPQPDAQPPTGDWWDELYAAAATDTHAAPADGAQPVAAAQPAAAKGDVEKTDADAQPDDRRTPWWARRTPVPVLDEEVEDRDDDPTVPFDDDADADESDDEDEGSAAAQPRRAPGAQPGKRSRRPQRSRGGSRRAPAPNAPVAAPLPRMSLLDAVANVPPRIRWLILHSSAAAAGYYFGWVQYSTRTAAWIADHGLLTVSGIFWCGCAIGCEVLRYRTRTYRLVARWAAAIPISSIVIGTLLYGTGWQNLELPL